MYERVTRPCVLPHPGISWCCILCLHHCFPCTTCQTCCLRSHCLHYASAIPSAIVVFVVTPFLLHHHRLHRHAKPLPRGAALRRAVSCDARNACDGSRLRHRHVLHPDDLLGSASALRNQSPLPQRVLCMRNFLLRKTTRGRQVEKGSAMSLSSEMGWWVVAILGIRREERIMGGTRVFWWV
ncbi:hypothetical protein HN51_018436 [Arachis hypogaea]